MGIIILVSLGNSCATAAPVSLENNWASATWEQLCQSHLGTILPVSLKNNRFSLTWKQLHQCHATWEQLCQYHLGIILPVSLGNNLTSLTLGANLPVSFVSNKQKWMKNCYFKFLPIKPQKTFKIYSYMISLAVTTQHCWYDFLVFFTFFFLIHANLIHNW